MKIAVIGSGISGLAAARAMSGIHDIHVFESTSQPGGHAHTVTVVEGIREIPIDTGFIVFNETTYPGFSKLLSDLDVSTNETRMSFSVSCAAHDIEYSSLGLRGMLAQPRAMLTPSRARMALEILRFYREAGEILDCDTCNDESLGEYLSRRGYGKEFTRHFIVPLVGCIWSTPSNAVSSYPARYLFAFLNNHGLLKPTGRHQWKTIRGGSRQYVERLVEQLPNKVRVSTPVSAIIRHASGVTVVLKSGLTEQFDHVVIATHSDQALQLLSEPTPLEKQALLDLRYKDSRVVLHTNRNVMPARAKAWASWNYTTDSCLEGPSPVSVSYHMNNLQQFTAEQDYFISVNPRTELAPEQIVAEFTYSHPQYRRPTQSAQTILRSLNGHNKIHFAGAYLGHGFHEDGLQSGLQVADDLVKSPVTYSPLKVPA